MMKEKVHPNEPCSQFFYPNFNLHPYAQWQNNMEMFNALDTSFALTGKVGLGGGIEIAFDKGFCSQILHIRKNDRHFGPKCISIIEAIKEGINLWMDRHPYLYVNWTNPITDTSNAEVIIATEHSALLKNVMDYGPGYRLIGEGTIAYAFPLRKDPETGEYLPNSTNDLEDIYSGTENFSHSVPLYRAQPKRGMIVFNTEYHYYQSDDDYEQCSKVGSYLHILHYTFFVLVTVLVCTIFYIFTNTGTRKVEETDSNTTTSTGDSVTYESLNLEENPQANSESEVPVSPIKRLSTTATPPDSTGSTSSLRYRKFLRSWLNRWWFALFLVLGILYLFARNRIFNICPDSSLNYGTQMSDWSLLFNNDGNNELYYKEKRCVNIKHIIAHEFGHLLGLGHADVDYQLDSMDHFGDDTDTKVSPKTYVDINPLKPCKNLYVRGSRGIRCSSILDPNVCNGVKECLFFDGKCRNEFTETLMASYYETRYNHVPSYTYRKRNETIITEDDLASLFFLYPSIYRNSKWGLQPIPLEDYSIHKLFVKSEDEYAGVCTTHLRNLTSRHQNPQTHSKPSVSGLRRAMRKYDNDLQRQQIIECLKEQEMIKGIRDLELLIITNCENRPLYRSILDYLTGRKRDCKNYSLLHSNKVKGLEIIQQQRKRNAETVAAAASSTTNSISSNNISNATTSDGVARRSEVENLISDIQIGKQNIEEELDGDAVTGYEDVDRIIDLMMEGTTTKDTNMDGVSDVDSDQDGLPDSIDDNIDVLLDVLRSVAEGEYHSTWDTAVNVTMNISSRIDDLDQSLYDHDEECSTNDKDNDGNNNPSCVVDDGDDEELSATEL